MTIRLDDGEVVLGPGDSYVVPKGVYHQPWASAETSVLLMEPSATPNTGDNPGALTAPRTVVTEGDS